MRVKKFTVTSTQLNTHAEISNTIPIDATGDLGVTLYPKRLKVVNSSGLTTVGILFLTPNDVLERAAYPARYDFIPLVAGVTEFTEINKCTTCILYTALGSASGAIDLYFQNYN